MEFVFTKALEGVCGFFCSFFCFVLLGLFQKGRGTETKRNEEERKKKRGRVWGLTGGN